MLSDLNLSPRGIFIGPEGGWSPEEQDFFNAIPDIHPVHLGPAILRAETAALVAATWMQYAHPSPIS
jgi:16S rRNA (uracil1498-N3)-methyltransferase